MKIYSQDGLAIEASGNSNVGGRQLHHNKLCSTLNSWNPLIRFTVSGNTQNVFLSIKAEYSNDRSTIMNNGGSWNKYAWRGVYCNSSGTMVDAYGAWCGESGGGGGSFDWSITSNYIQLQTYLWGDAALVNLPVYVVCSDWSKVTVTYY